MLKAKVVTGSCTQVESQLNSALKNAKNVVAVHHSTYFPVVEAPKMNPEKPMVAVTVIYE